MKTLIIDRDDNAANLIRSRLEPLGFKVVAEANKNAAVEKLAADPAGLVFIDPAPLNNARQMVIGIRRYSPTYVYVVQTGGDTTQDEAIAAGANDVLAKPFDMNDIAVKGENAKRLGGILKRLNDTSEDFPSAGGVIAKSAFAQLFLSAIDRADRYAERTYVMFLSLRNFNQIKVQDGDYAAGNAAAQLARQLSRIRRQSDILAQTGVYEYALLLQRPMYDNEPIEAANRFADNLAHSTELAGVTAKSPVDLLITLVQIPTGAQMAEHEISVKPASAVG